MIDESLARIFSNQWSVLVITSTLLLGLAEFGYRLGMIARNRNAKAAEGHSGAVQGAVLGLLGLLLGFSFAMAVGRYEARRTLVVEEADAIGTTWLRADFLPSPHREEIKDLLVVYTKQRIERFEDTGDPAKLPAIRREIGEIHQALWAKGVVAANVSPTPLTASFITSLNDTFDMDSERLAAMRNHVPGAVWLLLLAVSGCGAWASGFGSGTGGFRSAFSQFIFPILVGIVITLIVDIDRPRRGLIGVSQLSLHELLQSMQPQAP